MKAILTASLLTLAGLPGIQALRAADAYTPVSPILPPPAADSPYAGPTLMEPDLPAQQDYSFREVATTNSWNTASASLASSMLSYNFIDANYRYLDPKGGSLDGSHGLGVSLSLALFEPFFVKAGLNWSSTSGDQSARGAASAGYDLATVSVAGGVYLPITQRLHFVGEVGLVYADLDADGSDISYSEAGIYLRPAVRYQMTEWLELQGGVTLSSTDDYDSESLDLGAYFRVFPQVDLNVGFDFGDSNRTFRAGARLRW